MQAPMNFNYVPLVYCKVHVKVISHQFITKALYRRLRTRRALSIFNNVPLRTRRALPPLALYSHCTLLVLNGTSIEPFWLSTDDILYPAMLAYHWVAVLFHFNSVDSSCCYIRIAKPYLRQASCVALDYHRYSAITANAKAYHPKMWYIYTEGCILRRHGEDKMAGE